MNIELRKITDYCSFFVTQQRKNILALAISFVALAVFYLYRNIFSEQTKLLPHSVILNNIENLISKNLKAIKEKSHLTRILFRDALEKQESIARKMASDLGIPFHHFDGRRLEENSWTFSDLLRRISSGDTPKFIFVSHADEICQRSSSVHDAILVRTGSVSQQLLLCLGVSSKVNLPPDLASRYREQLIIDH